MLDVRCDGLCEPINPGGTATYGFVVYRGGERLHTGSGFVAKGGGVTNNVAEYTAVIRALTWIRDAGIVDRPVVVRSDSMLSMAQLSGEWAVRSQKITPFWLEARELATGLGRVAFVWVPREQNAEADALSRAAYREATGKDPPARGPGQVRRAARR